MTFHRCDVCRDEHPERAKVSTIEARINLYDLALQDGGPNHVLVSLDVCAKAACRRTGLKQLTEAVLSRASDRAGLNMDSPALPRAV